MKKVIIKSIKLTNFKGIRDLEVNFDAQMTSIYGRNASGKTTIFDAFTWLMFGKNSDDKKQFGIKTLDKDGNVIPRITHEVTAELDVDGKLITISRRLSEKWQKRRGTAEEEFKGNEETRLYNDVPMSVKEFSEKINAICTEDTFKMITNPLYFSSMSWQKQREMLISMAGDVTIDEVIKTNPKTFGALIDMMSGKSFEEFKKEISAKKRRIKEEVDTLPSRIDERKRDVVEEQDWDSLKSQLHEKEGELMSVEGDLLSSSNIVNKLSDDVAKVAEERAQLKADIAICRSNIENRVRMAYTHQLNQYNISLHNVQGCEDRIKRNTVLIEDLTKQLNTQKAKRESLLLQWREIKSRTLEFTEDMFVCPTCGRPLELDKIEEQQQKIIAKFNAEKAQDLEANKRQGLAVKSTMEYLMGQITDATNQIDKLNEDKAKFANNITAKPNPISDEDMTKMILEDEQYRRLCKRLNDFEAHQKNADELPFSDADTQRKVNELKEQRETLRGEINTLRSQLAMQGIAVQNSKRIKELEEQLRNQSEELARLEKIEFDIQSFTKTRIEMLEGKINAMFKFVRFRMFEQQINGGEIETCKAMVEGVPYDDLNNAMRINAGLDIINAICKSYGITAPIFTDNAESVNELINTSSQVIRLVVSEDDKLRIA